MPMVRVLLGCRRVLLGDCFLHCMAGRLCLYVSAGIIAKEPTSLEEEIKEIRRSGSNKALDTPEFELSDIFYFCRKGMEIIMDDEVTKRFSAEELESWNLLSRTNYNFHYISLRLTVLWGLGVLIRYCFLLPLRYSLPGALHLCMCGRLSSPADSALLPPSSWFLHLEWGLESECLVGITSLASLTKGSLFQQAGDQGSR